MLESVVECASMGSPCPAYLLRHTPRHVHIRLQGRWMVLSSAALGGGMVLAEHLLNLRVDGGDLVAAPPESTLKGYSLSQGWTGTVVGMMTAASMRSLAVEHVERDGIHLAAAVTSGLSNAKRIGEPAELQGFDHVEPTAHTINIQVLITAELTPAAMAESLAMAVEAKVAVLQNLHVPSATGAIPATGTGTDAIAVASLRGGHPVRYAGKHVLMGEMLGRTVIRALTRSLGWYAANTPCRP